MEHEESENCWCCPTLVYLDDETGVGVWLHKSDEELKQ